MKIGKKLYVGFGAVLAVLVLLLATFGAANGPILEKENAASFYACGVFV